MIEGSFMKHRIIGLLGANVSNENLGCVALTYSLVQCLESISSQLNIVFDYYIFEGKNDDDKRIRLCTNLNIDPHRVRSFSIYFQYSVKAGLFHLSHSFAAYQGLRECDLFIDLTSGDSFTDIYGQGRFDGTTKIKEMVQKWKKPIILGPQTYGPFNNPLNIQRAKRVIEASNCVISRDQASADYVKTFSDKKVYVTTDLAFALPYRKQNRLSDKICVGLNISSLLLSNKTESTQRNFEIKTDYDQYVLNVLDFLKNHADTYKTFVIPHVGKDGGMQFKAEYPEIQFIDAFEDPIAAKSFISAMDVFIGARMHATIAAYSSGVATIPVAYSRKFKGLYDVLSHRFVVDLQSLSTEEAVRVTLDYISKWESIKSSSSVGYAIFAKENKRNESLLKEYLEDLLK